MASARSVCGVMVALALSWPAQAATITFDLFSGVAQGECDGVSGVIVSPVDGSCEVYNTYDEQGYRFDGELDDGWWGFQMYDSHSITLHGADIRTVELRRLDGQLFRLDTVRFELFCDDVGGTPASGGEPPCFEGGDAEFFLTASNGAVRSAANISALWTLGSAYADVEWVRFGVGQVGAPTAVRLTDITVSSVPEPALAWLMATAAWVVGTRRRRRGPGARATPGRRCLM